MEHIHDDSVASIDCVPVYKSIVYVTTREVPRQQVISLQKTLLVETDRGVMFASTIVLLV